MKRDMDLCRDILLKIEASENEPLGWIKLDISDHQRQDVSYNIMLLAQAGLITARDLTTSSGFYWEPISLTWEGHEFLDAARSDSFWNKAKSIVREKAGTASFDVLKGVLVEMAKRAAISAIS